MGIENAFKQVARIQTIDLQNFSDEEEDEDESEEETEISSPSIHHLEVEPQSGS